MKTVIFDLDGTLALNDHRQHYLEGPKKDWDGFFNACDEDLLNEPIAHIFKALSNSCSVRIEIWSGRSDRVAEKTINWLNKHGLEWDAINMRRHDDYTPDEILKKKWLDIMGAEKILMVFDDRQKVVDMWRENGVTCAQVAKGAF